MLQENQLAERGEVMLPITCCRVLMEIAAFMVRNHQAALCPAGAARKPISKQKRDDAITSLAKLLDKVWGATATSRDRFPTRCCRVLMEIAALHCNQAKCRMQFQAAATSRD